MKTAKYKTSDYLETPEDVALYIEAALEEDDPKLLLAALRDVAESQGGMAMIARRTGLGRESLYKSLSENGNPKLSTLFEVFKKSLGSRSLYPSRRHMHQGFQ